MSMNHLIAVKLIRRSAYMSWCCWFLLSRGTWTVMALQSSFPTFETRYLVFGYHIFFELNKRINIGINTRKSTSTDVTLVRGG